MAWATAAWAATANCSAGDEEKQATKVALMTWERIGIKNI